MTGKSKIAALVCAALLIVILIGGIALKQHNAFLKQQAVDAATLAAEQAKQEAESKARQDFDVLLNLFIQDLATQAKAYRTQRIVLKESIHPLNFDKPSFAKESYTVFITDIAPMLRKAADNTIKTFQLYDGKANDMLKTMPDTLRTEIKTDWDTLQKDQLNAYITFFTKEDEIIRAHQDLIKFYATHTQSYTIDESGEFLLFDNEGDARQEKTLSDRIKSLQKKPATK